jgi:hypothetical protein
VMNTPQGHPPVGSKTHDDSYHHRLLSRMPESARICSHALRHIHTGPLAWTEIVMLFKQACGKGPR